MKSEIKVPAMGESISEATVGTFLKKSGEKVATDNELVELETDKVNQVLYAPQSGVVNWEVKEGDSVKIGQTLGYIDTDQVPIPQKPSEKEPEKPSKPEMRRPKPEVPRAPKTKVEVQPSVQASARIGKEEFLESLKTQTQATVPVLEKPSSSSRQESRKKMSKIRRIIANRLVDVMQQTAMLTTFNEVDMTAIMGLREAYKESFEKKYGSRLGFMSFFIKASVSALKVFPEINAYIDGEDLVLREYYDIGIAVGTDRGLIVPVVRNCDKLSFASIEQTIESFAKKARDGTLSADDLQGGGFTITNGGVYGSLLSTPILNPPQSAILGMHKIQKRAVVVNDTIVIRPMMYLALSYDHRVIDGKEAVSFLVHIKNCLEDPSRLLLDI